MAVASSAETMIALRLLRGRGLDERHLLGRVSALGPTWVTVPPRSVAACCAPLKATSKYGLLICLGMTTTLPQRAPHAAGADAGADAAAAWRRRGRGGRAGATGAGAAVGGGRHGAGVAATLQPASTSAIAATPPTIRLDEMDHAIVSS